MEQLRSHFEEFYEKLRGKTGKIFQRIRLFSFCRMKTTMIGSSPDSYVFLPDLTLTKKTKEKIMEIINALLNANLEKYVHFDESGPLEK